MRHKLIIQIVVFVVTLFSLFGSNTSAQVQLKVDWQQFLAKHDMVWDKMPADYYEGPFVGNGLLGAILFEDKQKENTLSFEIGRTDVYDHRSKNIKSTNPFGRLPIGRLLLTPVGTITSSSFRTDLWNAEITGTITTTKGTASIRCFVPSEEEFIVLNIKTLAFKRRVWNNNELTRSL